MTDIIARKHADNVIRIDPAHIPVVHQFNPGLYSRTMILPADYVVVGKRHRFESLFVMLYGHMLVHTDEYGVEEFIGPSVGTTLPDMQRKFVVLKESAFMNVHPNPDNETDIPTLEARYIYGE